MVLAPSIPSSNPYVPPNPLSTVRDSASCRTLASPCRSRCSAITSTVFVELPRYDSTGSRAALGEKHDRRDLDGNLVQILKKGIELWVAPSFGHLQMNGPGKARCNPLMKNSVCKTPATKKLPNNRSRERSVRTNRFEKSDQQVPFESACS